MYRRSKISAHGDVSLNLQTDGNHLVPDQENMLDDAFLQIRIKVMQPVQHATDEQVHCRAKVTAPGTTFLTASL